MDELLAYLDTLTDEQKTEWRRSLLAWADEREQAMFAKAKARDAKVFNVTATNADGKKYDLNWFVARDGEAAIQQARRMSAYAQMSFSAVEVSPRTTPNEENEKQ